MAFAWSEFFTMENLFSIGELITEYDQKRKQLEHLSGLGELTEATVRYYQQKGLYKPAGSRGKEARYAEDTLWRILFTRLVQLQSTQVLHTQLTLPAIARVLQSLEPEVVRRVALGEEPLSIGLLPDAELPHGEWTSFSVHPDVRLDVKRKLNKSQSQQMEMIARLVDSIIEGS